MKWNVRCLAAFGRLRPQPHKRGRGIKVDIPPFEQLQFLPTQAGIDGDYINGGAVCGDFNQVLYFREREGSALICRLSRRIDALNVPKGIVS
jgi:hypothetical protein